MPRPSPPPTPPQRNQEDDCVSDSEWELRTGRAMDILQRTLPLFFGTGLVATNYHLPLHVHGLLGGSLSGKGKGKGKAKADEQRGDDGEGIYARTIRLEYTPPITLPALFPHVLSIEGLPLYVASSVFVRHTMNTLYTDLSVSKHKVYVRSGPSSPTKGAPSPFPTTHPADDGVGKTTAHREKAITISLLVSGMGRLGLSAERAEWDVTSTYSFCPRTGLIARHTVNAIDPAPSETVYTALQNALATLSGGLTGPPGNKKGLAVAREFRKEACR
ncbi:hypothetical protein M0805_008533 [Coniferiporia weirii]|nr:hypothetical protein M0805_008533 [Coniferiporia weirii]